MSSRSSAREPDLYAVLEVARDASADDIRRAYKRLAVKWHPDKNPDNREHAEAQFKEVSAAYEILADPNTRTAYDRHGMAGVRGGGGGRTQMHDPFDIFNTFFANDPFASMFSGGGSRRRSTRGMHGMDDGFGRSDPFGGGFGGMGMGMGGMGMNMSQMMQSMMQDGGMGMDGMGGMGGMGNGQFMMSSMSSMGGMGGGVGKSVSQQTVIKDGKRVTRTVTRTTQADGTVHEDVEESINDHQTQPTQRLNSHSQNTGRSIRSSRHR